MDNKKASAALLLLLPCLLFATPASAATVDMICHSASAQNPAVNLEVCVRILGSVPTTSGSADERSLAVAVGDLGSQKAREVANAVDGVRTVAKERDVVKSLMGGCKSLYAVAAYSLKKAANAARDAKMGHANTNFSSGLEVADSCAAVFKHSLADKSPAAGLNDELYQIAAIGVYLTSKR